MGEQLNCIGRRRASLTTSQNENYGDSANAEALDPSVPEKKEKGAVRLIMAGKRPDVSSILKARC